MLFSLTATPTSLSSRGVGVAVFVHTRWLSAPPAKGRSRALDTAAELPDSPDEDLRPPRSPRYGPGDWQRRGLCRRLPLELSDPLFFGNEDRQAPEDLIVAVETARRMCDHCPVPRDCLTYALSHDMRYGVWGGTSGKQREKMRVRMALGASVEELVDECLPALPAPT